MSRVWRWARKRAGRALGPKQKRVDLLNAEPMVEGGARPSRRQARRAEGPKGGYAAEECGKAELFECSAPEAPRAQPWHMARAAEVVKGVARHLWRSKQRRQPPCWDMPAEL